MLNKHRTRVGLLEDMSSFLCPGGWVLRMISSDRDDRRIFWGLKFSISGFFWVGKFYQAFFSLGLLDLSRDFLGIQNNPKIRDSYIICCFLETFMAWKFVIGFFWGIFWGFVWSPKDFFGFWFLPPFDHPCHLKCPSPLGFCNRYYSNKIPYSP